ncbi:hypothetical protein B6E66_34400 [Streptomyces maremycinicus]|nr:hypothetical protein B6E66_34400 [Streptomyces sp. B9173]
MPDRLMVVFLGQITNSQVAFNNGTVTQSSTREMSGSHRTAAARTGPEPERQSPHGRRRPSTASVREPARQETTGRKSASLSGAEERCRVDLLEALGGLLDRLDLLGLSPEARNALRRDVRRLAMALERTPLDMEDVHTLIERVQARLPWDEAPEEHAAQES